MMLTLIACPTCHHKFSIPEGCMGHRRTCPNCQSIFVAGKSIAESDGRSNGLPRRGLLERAGDEERSQRPPLDKTMLAEAAPPIRYNCPRCQKPLESPASEAGAKKACPSCGGRLQIPALPSPPALDSNLNKTLLASNESSAQQPTTPSAPSVWFPPDGVPRNGSAQQPTTPSAPSAPSTVQPAPVPIPKPWTELLSGPSRKYVIGGLVAAGVAMLFLIGKHNANLEYEKLLQGQKQDLDKLKAEIDLKTALMQQQQQLDGQQRRQWEEMQAKQEARQRELDRERNDLRRLDDQTQAAEAKFKLDQKQRALEEEKRRAEEARTRAERETQEKLDSLKRQLDNANQKSSTIIQAPPAYPPWYGYYGRYPWW